jgi:hypothetical protein
MQIVSNSNSAVPQLVIADRNKDFCPVLVRENLDVQIIITEQTPDVQLVINVYTD